jgi:protein involved in polysaccharide export with SLBB domain
VDAPFVRTLLGVTLLAFAFPQDSNAAPPAVNNVPLPARGFPSEKELSSFLEPKPPIAIPDDPPPHEGAMFDLPYVAEPPDLLLVEVLEALPGRPISGERLVRPDGTISLGFYGDVHVRGLTEEQIKVKILLRLRDHLNDDYLGLYRCLELGGDWGSPPSEVEESADPNARGGNRPEMERDLAVKPLPDEAPPAKRQGKRARTRSRKRDAQKPTTGRPDPVTAPEAEREPNVSDASHTLKERTPPTRMRSLDPPPQGSVAFVAIHPADSDRVFVDVTAYNSKVYYVLGDVASPARMPYTGNETVLDALNYASGFIATANPKDIRLIRPARGGKPARTYRVDYEAITEKGDATANYQLFPGDRIVVGRNDVVKKTIQLDRLAGSLQTIFNSIMQYNFMVGSLKQLGNSTTGAGTGTTTLTEAQREAIVKVWAEFWGKAMAETDGVTFDEKRLHEALLRALEPAAKGADESKLK